MEAIQLQTAQIQAVQLTGLRGQGKAQAGQVQGFEALLLQMLSGEAAPESDAFFQLLAEGFSEEEDPTQAAMQMVAELFAAQPGLVQVLNPENLAQLTGQPVETAHTALAGIGSSLPDSAVPVLSQLTAQLVPETLPKQTQQPLQSFAENLGKGFDTAEIQVTRPDAMQDGTAFGQAGFQRAVFQAQRQMQTPQDAPSEETDAFAQLAAAQGKQKDTVQHTAGAMQQPPLQAVEAPLAQPDEPVDVQALLKQVKTGIEQAVKAEQENFVIKLKPEGLGEITVRMVQQAGKIAMEITASNQNTQRLLSSELAGLRQVMEPYQVVVTTGQSPNAQNGFDMQQQAWQQGFAQQHGRQPSQQSAYDIPQDETAVQELLFAQQAPLTELDTYI